MNNSRATIVLFFYMAIGFASTFIISCKEKTAEGIIIITRYSGNNNQSYVSSVQRKEPLQTQLAAIDPAKPDAEPAIISAAFFSANCPQISSDGKFLLFAGQQKQGDTWQIWEADLSSFRTRQLTKLKNNCTDPAYLPTGRFIFSSHAEGDSLKAENSLYTCNIDGSDLRRITFNPHTYFASHVLNDGRILASGNNVFPVAGRQKFFVMRPDGTKSELFYNCNEGCMLESPGLEAADGKVIFVEADNTGKEDIISVSYNRPLHTRMNLTHAVDGNFQSVFPEKNGKLLVCYKKSASDRFGLWEFDPINKSLGKSLYSGKNFDILEAVIAEKYQRQRKMPSEVNSVLKTGLLMCQDVNIPDNIDKRTSAKSIKVSKVQIMGVDSSMGTFRPSADGSFYLKILADKPFQIRTLDEQGKVIQSCDWIWLRPNERRGCVGCHEDQDMAPDNRIPAAVRKAPIGIPIHVSKIKDKMIDTE